VKRSGDYWLGIFIFLVVAGLVNAGWAGENHSKTAPREGKLRIGVVGDTGIGERAFHMGFVAVQKALRESNPDVLLHLGDFVYQPKFQPHSCPEKYIQEIRETLVEPYPFRLFVPGDNDLPPHLRKPKASGCWSLIDPLDTPFDDINAESDEDPARFEGTKIIGNTFFAILNTYPWKDPTGWLAPQIKAARENGLWVIMALHEPAITTAWYLDKRDTVLKQVNALKPDLVFSGNQHSYERFHPLGIPEKGKSLPVKKSESSSYQRGEGTIHIVSGGGGATFKPFADQQGYKNRTAPEDVFNALAKRALMNHYIILEVSTKVLKGVTYRVCPGAGPTGKSNPRWKPDKPMWENITLECEGKPEGIAEFDQFEITR
jgi:calcineurin-like phosphoesterase family protein